MVQHYFDRHFVTYTLLSDYGPQYLSSVLQHLIVSLLFTDYGPQYLSSVLRAKLSSVLLYVHRDHKDY